MKKLPKSLITPVLLVVILDITFTLIGQPTSYWSNYSKLNEGSPLGVLTLSQSPQHFVALMFVYTLFIYILLRKLPLFLSTFLAISFYLGHVYGSSSWVNIIFAKVFKFYPELKFSHWYISIGYLVLVSLITTFFIFKASKKQNLKNE